MQPNGYKVLRILFFALLAGQLLFLAIAFFLTSQLVFSASLKSIENILMPVLAILALACVFIGNKIFKSRIQKLAGMNTISEKFAAYRTASIIRWAMLEAACLFGIISFMLTANNIFLFLVMLILFIFGSTAPIKNKVAIEMGISADELDTIS